jgi:hypothetical protein
MDDFTETIIGNASVSLMGDCDIPAVVAHALMFHTRRERTGDIPLNTTRTQESCNFCHSASQEPIDLTDHQLTVLKS